MTAGTARALAQLSPTLMVSKPTQVNLLSYLSELGHHSAELLSFPPPALTVGSLPACSFSIIFSKPASGFGVVFQPRVSTLFGIGKQV